MKNTLLAFIALLAIPFTGCQTTTQSSSARGGIETVGLGLNYSAVAGNIAAEPAGNYFIGRRYYMENFYYWGYIRKPGQPWREARLVMLNENRKLTPDRAGGKLGTDHNSEYKMAGYFSGDTVYEAASNAFYPEFVVTDMQLVSTNPPSLFNDKRIVRGQRPDL